MSFEYAKFKDYRCFKNNWAGFEEICPVNVIIGRNNAGKSALLSRVHLLSQEIDLACIDESVKFCNRKHIHEIRSLANEHFANSNYELSTFKTLDKILSGEVTWQTVERDFHFGSHDAFFKSHIDSSIVKNFFSSLCREQHVLHGKQLRLISSERDVELEKLSLIKPPEKNGRGATNAITTYLTSANSKYPRSIVQQTLLKALNTIFSGDVHFEEIEVQLHDSESNAKKADHWEIYLSENSKGLIPLSKSGSGIKTVLLVLINLLVVPEIEGKEPSDYVFCFEELENNLHPAAQRRLFRYIENFAVENNCYVFLTTHSNVVLDVFAESKNAQILHVEHDGTSASVKRVDTFFDQRDVLDDLGAKASDLLQANGIVWLEGPSDRIYFNKWVSLLDDNLQEGIDYQCVFYGGSILKHYEGEEEGEHPRILQINRNAILIADGDRTTADAAYKPAVLSMQADLADSGTTWITQRKEVESYIPTNALKTLWKKPDLPEIDPYEPFHTDSGNGYFPQHSPTKTFNKVNFARTIAPKLTKELLETIPEWREKMQEIVATIQTWNAS